MALAGLGEELTYKIRTARPKRREPAAHATSAQVAISASEVADQQLIARLASLGPLTHAAKVACKSLQHLGEGLRRSNRSIRSDGVFLQQLQEKEPPMAAGSVPFLDALDSLGELFCNLSRQLDGKLLTPMEALQNNLKEACMEERLELKEMEQREALCSRAVGKILQRKERATAELQAVTKQETRRSRPTSCIDTKNLPKRVCSSLFRWPPVPREELVLPALGRAAGGVGGSADRRGGGLGREDGPGGRLEVQQREVFAEFPGRSAGAGHFLHDALAAAGSGFQQNVGAGWAADGRNRAVRGPAGREPRKLCQTILAAENTARA
ncbi:unnamed protein product [Effrenium voratum]|nr:unnamed protein product [Effrenium voratum]